MSVQTAKPTDTTQQSNSAVVIMPTCDDSNRGDQALVWETKRVAELSGYRGRFFMLGDPDVDATQSTEAGIGTLVGLLQHPRTRYAPQSNLTYGPLLVLIWGSIAVVDTLRSVLLLTRFGRLAVRPLLTRQARHTLETLEDCDACFVKGGGLVHSTSSVTDPYRAYFALFHVLLALCLGKKVFVMPNSFGPFDGRLFRGLVRRVLTRCVLVTARESISAKALEAIGVDAEIYPDLGFSLHSSPVSDSPIDAIRRRVGDKTIVAFTARPYRFPYSSQPERSYETYINEMATLIVRTYQAGYVPIFIEHVISQSDHESDILAINQIMRRLVGLDVPIVSKPDYTCQQLKTLYSQCDYVVGTRFHSVIFALSQGVPSLAIAYGGNKAVGIMRDLGLGQYALPIEDFTADAAFAALLALMNDQGLARELSDHMQALDNGHSRLVARIGAHAGA